MMDLPREFLRRENFELAFWRIAKSSKLDYKQYYRHILASYSISLRENVADLIDDIKRGRYTPSEPTIVFHPKKSGILRPLTLLAFRDLIVYQAVVNIVANRMRSTQQKFAYKKCFGALLTSATSEYFFRSWKKAYSAFNDAVRSAHEAENVYVADFDLVACYELIDHGILRSRLAGRAKDEDLLNFLFHCLSQWTTNSIGKHLRHGIPQGPDASSFLAECLLFDFDAMNFNGAKYVRYIDDIKLMAKEEIPLRRALLRLDLKCKELGLVPQAQKINLGRVDDVSRILKSIPSMIVAKVEKNEPGSQVELMKMLRSSMEKTKEGYSICQETEFKFALARLNPRQDVLKRIAPLLIQRPDLSPCLSRYLRKFKCSKAASDILLDTLKRDPTYDASASDYIGALDSCEPDDDHREYRRVVNTAKNRWCPAAIE